jgi:hypothetical protein
VTDADDFSGAGEVVESGGVAWTLAHVGITIRGKFSAWLKARARQGLQEERRTGALLSVEQYREEADALKRQFDAGAYNWGSPFDPDGMGSAVSACLQETEGKVKLVQLLLEPAHGAVEIKTVLSLLTAAPQAVADALRACLGLPPNPPSPAMTTPGMREYVIDPKTGKQVEVTTASPTATVTPSSRAAASAAGRG